MKPWKRVLLRAIQNTSVELQWGHGDEAVEEACDPSRSGRPGYCFNGATAMKPWKSASTFFELSLSDWLQWGHGDEAVEEDTPTLLRRRADDRLQWGHGDEAVEEAAPP